MFEIDKPFAIGGLPFTPEITGRLQVEEKIIQTLAALLGYDGERRRLLTCSPSGSLNAHSPLADAFINKASTGATEDVTFTDQATSEVMIMANASNSGDVWVNIGAAAAVDTGWPLDAGDAIRFSLNNMLELNLHIITSGDKVIILRTV